jgi:hypothetical protein
MDVKIRPARKLTKRSKISACIAFLLIMTSLSLNFFTKPASCPMEDADGGMGLRVCDCCAVHHHMQGHCHSVVSDKSPGMSCHCGMCHITNRCSIPSHANDRATIYLQLRAVACLPPFITRPFTEYKTNPALFLLGEEKDRPPVAY